MITRVLIATAIVLRFSITNPHFTPGALAHTHGVTHALYLGQNLRFLVCCGFSGCVSRMPVQTWCVTSCIARNRVWVSTPKICTTHDVTGCGIPNKFKLFSNCWVLLVTSVLPQKWHVPWEWRSWLLVDLLLERNSCILGNTGFYFFW